MAAEELRAGQCGLDYSNAQLHLNDSKNFGPEKFRANSADVFCGIGTCPLASGVEVKFSTIAAPTAQEVVTTFEIEATNPESRISEQLRRARLDQCPFYKQQFSSDNNIKR